MSKQTALYVISGPSGVGKGTVCKALLAELGEGPNRQLTLSISATTRPMRPGEVDGVNYHFLSQEDFLRRVDNGEFLEYATVYGNYYGTLRSAVQQELAEPIRQKSSGLSAESREDKARRLQWLLQQLIRETLRENNEELCQSMKESLIKELDYQFRSQEEREEERDRLAQQRSEEYYRKMDELLCKKSRRKADKADKKERAAEKVKPPKPTGDKKKRHFVF